MGKMKTINIPIEYKRLFDKDWREAAIYGGRFCFTGDTIISLENDFKRIDNLKVGDKVLSLEGDYDIITSIDRFESNFDPKPMLEIIINEQKTNTTYDHKYFNGTKYVPVYQLVWRSMDEHQRRTLELLCKQYGENTNNELQRWIQDQDNDSSIKSFGVSYDSSRKEISNDTQTNSENFYTKSRKQGNSKSQEWDKNRQSSGKFGMGIKNRAINSSLEDRVKTRCSSNGKQFQKINREASKRIFTIPFRESNNANKNDGEIFSKQKQSELRGDKRYFEWKNLESSSKGISTQETNNLGSQKEWIKVVRVYESTEVWSITTEKYHNYFANGINVSNSLKSHTVARALLIRARQEKIRIGCFREFQNSIADSSYQLLADLIKEYELKDFELTKNSIINNITGSDFIFKGLWNNEQSIKSIEGIDIAWVEEAQTISEKSIEILTPTIRKDGSQIIYTYNRLREEDPVHKRLVLEGRPNTLIINVNYDIALKYKWMPDVIKQEMEDDKARRPALFRHKWLGEPYSLEGRVYKDWLIIDEIPHEARLIRRGLDFGYTNDPTATIDIYYYNGGYILDEICYQKGLSNKQIYDIISSQKEQTLVIGDSAEPKSIDELKLYGLNITGAVKGRDSINQGIQFVQDQKISITKRSINTIKEYNNYIWKVDKDGTKLNVPEDKFNHSMDAIRYGFDSLNTQTDEEPINDPSLLEPESEPLYSFIGI